MTQRWTSGRGVVTYGLAWELSSASVIILSSSSRSFCKHPWRASPRLQECAVAEGPWEHGRRCPKWRNSLPEKESRWILVTRRRLPRPTPSKAVPFGNQKCPCPSPQTLTLTATLTQLSPLRSAWKSMAKSLLITIWPSTSG